ncbi:MAG TPA: nitroreductase family deazaflavin-dependent oxidoreductase [Micromonosporaceae bacterium]|nr:nitroreductase family deazaflavin-dependent oxidoreductase [Micromonosporaceae bacterium]
MSRLVDGVRRAGHRPWFARVGRALTPVDRMLGKLSRGRTVAFGFRELPSMVLTTTGRRTGQPRDTPLLYVRDGDGYVVIGSNWGQRTQPAWSGNLLANPEAVVTHGGRRIPVRARLVTGDERDRDIATLRSMWPAYATYEARAGGRELRVFRLDPVD